MTTPEEATQALDGVITGAEPALTDEEMDLLGEVMGLLDDLDQPGVQPVEDEAEFRLRTHMGDGEIEGEAFEVALNIDSGAVLISFEDGPRMMFRTQDMVKAAYRAAFEEDDK